ncbi:pectinesterase family protein [Hymenobacter negativus]|uniref:Pectinesterase n=1 Tax=Hymenobacter negativus TaxID=2795026 RepID=A0ABS3QDZ2_9BACT|nr:pectinesterase family protein [Hymenobacter negativus]MBO2009461.1 pectin esterase [Hymenobacter negativus]
MKLLSLTLCLAAFAAHAQTAPQSGPITVAQDGSGTYRTVQEAVDAVPNQPQKTITIFIKKGTYREKLVVPTLKTHIKMVGEDAATTILTFNDHTGDAAGHNTYTSHSVLVQANDFSAENLTFENNAGYTAGQAVALHVEGDRCTFRHCRVVGNQDILFLATDRTRQYFQDCYLEGTTDFIFGASTAVFDHCIIKSKKNSFITAASTPPQQQFGFVFLGCKLTADTALAKKVHLGRPWRPSAKVVYLNTEMGSHIAPAGWDNWKNPENEKTAYFAEYNSTGPGAKPAGRVGWSHQLTAKEAKQYTIKTIFAASEPWVPGK